MPLRGESVGTAYVRILADATGFPDSLREEFDRNEPGIKRQGRHTAEAFKEGFDEEVKRGEDLNLRDVLNKSLGENKATQEFFKGREWDRFKSRMRSEFGQVGELSAHELEEKFVNSGSLKGLDHEVENIISRISKTTERVIKEQGAGAETEASRLRDFEAQFRTTVDNNARSFTSRLESARSLFHRFRTDAERDGKDLTNVFSKLGVTIDHASEGIGKAFGAGNRNNFLNFVGNFVGGIGKVIGLPIKLAGNLGEMTSGFRNALSEGQGFFSSVQAGFTTMAKDAEGGETALSSLVSTGVPGLIALAVVAGILVTALGPVVALVSGLAAAVIALASAISFAIIGSLAPLVGLLAPLALGVGAAVAAVLALNQQVKTSSGQAIGLKQTLTPLITEFLSLGKATVAGFISVKAMHGGFALIKSDMELLRPLFHDVGVALGQFVGKFTQVLGGQQAQHFFDVMDRFAPRAIGQLLTAVLNIGSALSAIFIDTIPQARTFLGWLDRITGRFEEFVTENPKEVRTFLHEAANSAKTVWHFLGASLDLLDTLLFSNSGRKAGDSIFASLTKQIEKFNNSLRPKSQGSSAFDEAAGGIKNFRDNAGLLPKTDPLAGFFKEGKVVADDLGRIALALTTMIADFNTPQAQAILNFILGLGGALVKIEPVVKFIAQHPLGILLTAWFGPVGPALEVGLHAAETAVKHVKSFFSHLSFGIGGSGVTALTIKPPNIAWIGGVVSRIGGFAADVAHTFAGINNRVSGIWGSMVRLLVSLFAPLAGKIGTLASSIPGRLSRLVPGFVRAAASWVAGILSEISGVPQSIVDMFAGLAGRIINAIGPISLHVSLSAIGKGAGLLSRLGLALGGITDGPVIAGEAGREAVVPLDRPLSQIDPSVRWLAAIAQGQKSGSTMAQVPTGAGKTVNVTQNISTPTADPVAAANEWLAHLAASGY